MTWLRGIAGPLQRYLCRTPLSSAEGTRLFPEAAGSLQVRHKKSQPRITINALETPTGVRDDLAIKDYTQALRESGMQRDLKERSFFVKPCQRRRKERSDTLYRIQSRELRKLIKMAMEKKASGF